MITTLAEPKAKKRRKPSQITISTEIWVHPMRGYTQGPGIGYGQCTVRRFEFKPRSSHIPKTANEPERVLDYKTLGRFSLG